MKLAPLPPIGDDARVVRAPRTLARGWFIGYGVVLALMAVLGYVTLNTTRDAAEARAFVDADNIARGMRQNFESEIGRIDMALQTMVFTYERASAGNTLDEALVRGVLAEQQSLVPGADTFRMTDASGIARFGVGAPSDGSLNLSDRAYFQIAQQQTARMLIISEPILARIRKKWVIVFARRLNRPDGSFAGIVYASVLREHFERRIAEFDIGMHGAAALRSGSLRMIARQPPLDDHADLATAAPPSQELRDHVGRSPQSGTYSAIALSDGVERAVAYQRVGNAPMFVVVGLAKTDFLAPWRTYALQTLLLYVLVALSLGALAMVGYRWQIKAWSTDTSGTPGTTSDRPTRP